MKICQHITTKIQRDAKEWERVFLETQQADLTMPFASFVKIYNEDMKQHFVPAPYTLQNHAFGVLWIGRRIKGG